MLLTQIYLSLEMTDPVAKIDAFWEEISLIEDISELNQKRRTKKTTITKVQNFLEKLYLNPENLSIVDLVKKFDGLDMACKQYIIVAERVAVIEEWTLMLITTPRSPKILLF